MDNTLPSQCGGSQGRRMIRQSFEALLAHLQLGSYNKEVYVKKLWSSQNHPQACLAFLLPIVPIANPYSNSMLMVSPIKIHPMRLWLRMQLGLAMTGFWKQDVIPGQTRWIHPISPILRIFHGDFLIRGQAQLTSIAFFQVIYKRLKLLVAVHLTQRRKYA